MDTNDSLRQTLEHFLQQRQKKVDEIRALDLTIKQIRQELGEQEQEGEAPPAITGEFPPMVFEAPLLTRSKQAEQRPDEFFGMSQGDAARAYLKKKGHAVSIEELVDALTQGGCKVGGIEPKRTLYISLVRNTRDFVPPRQGFIGLREFYPNFKASKLKKAKD